LQRLESEAEDLCIESDGLLQQEVSLLAQKVSGAGAYYSTGEKLNKCSFTMKVNNKNATEDTRAFF
jgi:hypothetical protein